MLATVGAIKGGQALGQAVRGKGPSDAQITQARIDQIRAEQGAGKFETMLNDRAATGMYAGR